MKIGESMLSLISSTFKKNNSDYEFNQGDCVKRFPTVKYLEKEYNAECMSNKGYPVFRCKKHMPGIQIATNIYICNTDEHTDAIFHHFMVIGETGTGKSSGVYIPNLLNEKLKNTSFVVLDPSGELFEKTSKFQKSLGKEVYLLSLEHKADRFNVLDLLNNELDILNYCKKLFTTSLKGVTGNNGEVNSTSASWYSMSAPILTSAIIFLKCFYKENHHLGGKATMSEAIKLVTKLNSKEYIEAMKMYDESYEALPFNEDDLNSNPFKNCMFNIKTNLSYLTKSQPSYLMGDTTIPIEKIREVPMTIYIKIDNDEVTKNATIFTPIIESIVKELTNQSHVENSHKNPNEILDAFLLFDEFPVLGKLDKISSYLTLLRKHRVCTFLATQNYNKLGAVYTENEIEEIRKSTKHKIYFTISEDSYTAKIISENSGTYEDWEWDYNYNSQDEVIGKKARKVVRNYVTYEEALKIPQGVGYIIISGLKRAVPIDLVRYFECPRFVNERESLASLYDKIVDDSYNANPLFALNSCLNKNTETTAIKLKNNLTKLNIHTNNVTDNAAITYVDDGKSILDLRIAKFLEENFV